MEQGINRLRLPFWLQWILATAIGMGFGYEVARIVSPATQGLLFLSVPGIFMGCLQWLVLKKRVNVRGWWVLATFSAFLIFDLVGWIVPSQVKPLIGQIFLALGGLTLGFTQWLLLRHHYARAHQWILANTLAWLLGMILAFCGVAISVSLSELSGVGLYGLSGFTMAVFFGTPLGAVTAYVLNRLSAQHMS